MNPPLWKQHQIPLDYDLQTFFCNDYQLKTCSWLEWKNQFMPVTYLLQCSYLKGFFSDIIGWIFLRSRSSSPISRARALLERLFSVSVSAFCFDTRSSASTSFLIFSWFCCIHSSVSKAKDAERAENDSHFESKWVQLQSKGGHSQTGTFSYLYQMNTNPIMTGNKNYLGEG